MTGSLGVLLSQLIILVESRGASNQESLPGERVHREFKRRGVYLIFKPLRICADHREAFARRVMMRYRSRCVLTREVNRTNDRAILVAATSGALVRALR